GGARHRKDLCGKGGETWPIPQVRSKVVILAVQHHLALTVDEIDLPTIAALVTLDQRYHGVDRQANAGSADKSSRVILHPVIDKNADAGAIRRIFIDIDIVVSGVVAQREIPVILRVLTVQHLDNAVG